MKIGSNNEILKSTCIGVLALAALICWLQFQPRLPNSEPKEAIGRPLFENFSDPSQMRKIEFVGIDPASGETRRLTLVRNENDAQWRLPDMSNFPAENADRLAKVVAPLTQLVALDVIDEPVRDKDSSAIDKFHRECGLLSPSKFIPDLDGKAEAKKTDEESQEEKNLARGSATSVKIEGESGETLVDLLIGDRLPESAATRDARYVRFPNDDVVYTVDFSGDSTQEVGTTEFTEFPARVSYEPIDWIDRDLLRISRWDVLFLTTRDYAFNLTKQDDQTFARNDFNQVGIEVFRQTPENSLSRVWSLARRFDYSAESASWQEASNVDPESAQNDVLNETADALGRLKIVDVRKKPDALVALFHEGRVGAELTTQLETLGEFGFATLDYDPLDPKRVEPFLVGEGGTVEIATREGVKITLVFGKKFDDKRACLAYASFDRKSLEESTEDETELVFLATDAEKKAVVKNDRFAEWFYFIAEEDYQSVRFRSAQTLKVPDAQ